MKTGEACATGGRDRAGRRCPRVENQPRTAEGAALWNALRGAGAWTGGGFTPLRLDRPALAARVADAPRWAVDTLLDAFEVAAVASLRAATKRRPGGGGATREG